MIDVWFWKKVIQADRENIKKYGMSSFGPYDGSDDDNEEDYNDEEWED